MKFSKTLKGRREASAAATSSSASSQEMHNRFLQRNDFPGIDRFQRRLQVQMVRQKQFDQVDVFSCQQTIQVVVDVNFSAPPRMRPLPSQVRVAVAERT